MNNVLDACGMIAYLRGEEGAPIVAVLLEDPAETCYAHPVNLCEVYYVFLRRADEATAREAISDLLELQLIERKDMSKSFWQQVGRLKPGGNISLADCFCVTLAQRLSAQLLTTDHNEFEPLVSQGLCIIKFIR